MRFFRQAFRYNFRPEVDIYVISGAAVDYVRAKFVGSGPNGFRHFRGADFVSNERTNMIRSLSHSPKMMRIRYCNRTV